MVEYNYFICHCTCGIHDRALICHSHFFPNSGSTVNTKIQIEYSLSVCTYSVFLLHEHSPTCHGEVPPSLLHLFHAAGEACCPHSPGHLHIMTTSAGRNTHKGHQDQMPFSAVKLEMEPGRCSTDPVISPAWPRAKLGRPLLFPAPKTLYCSTRWTTAV